MAAQFQDITVMWGQPRDQLDMQMSRWWTCVFQDMYPTGNGAKLLFLFDDTEDGRRQIGPQLVVFDTVYHKFVRQIPIKLPPSEGRCKYCMMINEGTLALCTQVDWGGRNDLHFHRIQLTPDGGDVQYMAKTFGPIPVSEDWIICKWGQNVVLMSGPGLTVWKINIDTRQSDSFIVPSGNLHHYYDATIEGDMIYLFPARPDGTFDFSYVHVIDIRANSDLRAISTNGDPQHNFPQARKQCALDSWNGHLYVLGGESEGGGRIFRLMDTWQLNLQSYRWRKLIIQLPLPIIEPRLSIVGSLGGQVFVWGDCDNKNGCYTRDTHLHIYQGNLGYDSPPPSYPDAAGAGMNPSPPPYPPAGGPPPGYPSSFGSAGGGGGQYPSMGGAPAPSYAPPAGGGGGYGYPPNTSAAAGSYPPQGSPYPPQQPQHAYYPDQQKEKKDCTIS